MKPETFASLVSALLYEKRFLLYKTPDYLLLNMNNLLGLHVFRCDFINDLLSCIDLLFKKIGISGVVIYIVLRILFENIKTNGFLIDSPYLLMCLLLLLECVKT